MIVYKYLSAENALDDLRDLKVRVGRMNDLNDIYDCKPRLIHEDGLADDFADVAAGHYGIICYCQRPDNLLLWSHYGDKHKGIALGFDMEPWEPKTAMPEGRRIIKVDYDKSNIRKKVSPPFGDTGSLKTFLATSFTTKGGDWEYEQEYREFIHLAKCVPTPAGYFARCEETLKRVILGMRCSVEERLIFDILGWAQGLTGERPHNVVEVSRAIVDEVEFKVRIKPIGSCDPAIRIQRD